MKTIHWIGAGLSSAPGIRNLVTGQHPLVLWNRTVERARNIIPMELRSRVPVQAFSIEHLALSLSPGDIVVSMLPASIHVDVAHVCLARKAHLVTTSYISPAMRALHSDAVHSGLTFLNEAGVDPGLDHLLAHDLVHRMQSQLTPSDVDSIDFVSLCGGFPVDAGAFKYKFSWSPLGVLRALRNSSRHIEGGKTIESERSTDAIFPVTIAGEPFEAYPNRDSLAYVAPYQLDTPWRLDRFVRGTLRPPGWHKAWQHIFEEVSNASDEQLEALSASLWRSNQYQPGEADRVVLSVQLKARRGQQVVFDETRSIDLKGTAQDSAMSRLVSLPAALAAAWIGAERASAGVCGLPDDPTEMADWLQQLRGLGIHVTRSIKQ